MVGIAQLTLNRYAKNMVTNMTCNLSGKNETIKNFFQYANKNGQQGNALVSYYTEWRTLRHNRNLSSEASERVHILPDLIDKAIKTSPDLQQEADAFVSTLERNYPKTLERRISIASHGAVVSDKIQPKSRFKKFLITLNEFMKPVE